MTAIADYLTMAQDKPSISAIRPRLNHVLNYMTDKSLTGTRCEQIDDAWIGRFRSWAASRPIVSPKGNERTRSLGTIENSVLQLRAAVAAYGGILPRFKVTPVKTLNRTPQHRSDVAELVRMFRYCLYPEGSKARSPEEIARRSRERANLLAFLRISVVTMARPDAAHMVDCSARARQWSSQHSVLNLNPAMRRQTRKYRATVPIAKKVAHIFDAAAKEKQTPDNPLAGLIIKTVSVKSAWESMAAELKLPVAGESGMKLIRRSMAHIARSRLPEEAWGEVSMFLGHDRFDEVSDLYAPFSPTYLRRVLTVIEAVIEEIESACPGAFYRTFTARSGNVIHIGAGRNA